MSSENSQDCVMLRYLSIFGVMQLALYFQYLKMNFCGKILKIVKDIRIFFYVFSTIYGRL